MSPRDGPSETNMLISLYRGTYSQDPTLRIPQLPDAARPPPCQPFPGVQLSFTGHKMVPAEQRNKLGLEMEKGHLGPAVGRVYERLHERDQLQPLVG